MQTLELEGGRCQEGRERERVAQAPLSASSTPAFMLPFPDFLSCIFSPTNQLCPVNRTDNN
jgi:hypothetical protein